MAHRRTGVASYDIRQAERHLQDTLSELIDGTTIGGDHNNNYHESVA
jgi:hypothetical protein